MNTQGNTMDNTKSRARHGKKSSGELHKTRTKLADRALPDYTRGEEIFNVTSHAVGGVFGIVALALCLISAFRHSNPWAVAGGVIFGTSMILLYTVSSVYHGLTHVKAKKVFQVIDHCTIYFLIAGTYTPVLITDLREYNSPLAWSIFGVVWALSALAIVLTAIDLKKFKVFSMICYLLIGWCIIFAAVPLVRCYSFGLFFWLLAGGIAYTVGSILYGIGSKGSHRYAHSMFHLFVLAGSVFHFAGIFLYCM